MPSQAPISSPGPKSPSNRSQATHQPHLAQSAAPTGQRLPFSHNLPPGYPSAHKSLARTFDTVGARAWWPPPRSTYRMLGQRPNILAYRPGGLSGPLRKTNKRSPLGATRYLCYLRGPSRPPGLEGTSYIICRKQIQRSYIVPFYNYINIVTEYQQP